MCQCHRSSSVWSSHTDGTNSSENFHFSLNKWGICETMATVYQNQKELYCQVCLHTQGICFGAEASIAQIQIIIKKITI